MMKKLLIRSSVSICLLALTISLLTISISAETTSSAFPIGAWNIFLADSIPTTREIRNVKDVGINFGHQWIHKKNLMLPILNKIAPYGLKLAIGNESIILNNLTATSEIVTQNKGHKGLWGYYLKDEPDDDYFPTISAQKNRILALDPNACWFVNHKASWDPGIRNSFETHLKNYISTCDPKFLSVDTYPLIGNDMKSARLNPTFYSTYEVISKVAKAHKIPFYAVILATTLRKDHPAPDLINMRFAVFNALAYGAQAIIWWSYNPLPNKNSNFKNFPVDSVGNLTQTWQYMKTINKEIQRYKDVFLGCNVTRTFFADNVTPSNSFYKVTHTSPITMPLSPGTLEINWKGAGTDFTMGYLFSQIMNNGHEYLVIVSQDWINPQTLHIKSQGTCIVMNPDGSETTLPLTSSRTIPAGGYIILRLH